MATTYRVGPGQTYTTITAALTQAEADGVGDTRIIDIDAGTYNENITLGILAWTRANHLEFISNSGSRDVIVNGSGGAQAFNLNSQQHVRMNGIIVQNGTANQIINIGHYSELTNCKASGTGIGFYSIQNMGKLENCEADTCAIGFQVSWGYFILDCYVHDCTSIGINFDQPGEQDIEATRVIGNAGDGIRVASAFAVITMRNCTIAGNAKGVDLESSGSQFDLVDCIIADNTNYGIDVAAPFRCCRRSEGNIWYNNTNGHINVQGDSAKTTLAQVRTWTRSQTGRSTEDANSAESDPVLASDGTLDTPRPDPDPVASAGVSGSLMKGGDFSVDVHHPGIGADGSEDSEQDTPVTPPAVQPTLDQVTDEGSGDVKGYWTIGTPGNTGKLFARKLTTKTWTEIGSDTASPIDGTGLDTDVTYEFMVEEYDGIYSGVASNAVQKFISSVDGSPWEQLLDDVDSILKNSAALAEYAGAGEWPGRVLRDIDERLLPPREAAQVPYLEYDIPSMGQYDTTYETEHVRVEIRLRFTAHANDALAEFWRMIRDAVAALRAGLGVPEEFFIWTPGTETMSGEFRRVDVSISIPMAVGRTTQA